ncbi:MAG: M20/M25/M40 family metallo-hydrolase, partial [Tagaea sp.]
MTRETAIANAERYFDEGGYRADLARRVAIPTESQNPDRGAELARYLDAEMRPAFEKLGFVCRVIEHPKAKGPFLLATRIEDPKLPTVFGYGHGDVIRGLDEQWRKGLSPWEMKAEGDRWYGRGTADNKGQHSINIGAMAAVLAARGKLGFNAKYLIEMGEEMGSPGLREVCEANKADFAADMLLASDGPRLRAERPTLFLGSRGSINFDLTIDARAGGHHSGNWGGLISNPGLQLAHAISTIAGPTGQIRIPEWVPAELPESVRRALADCEVDGGADGPAVEPWWGEPGLSPAERVF